MTVLHEPTTEADVLLAACLSAPDRALVVDAGAQLFAASKTLAQALIAHWRLADPWRCDWTVDTSGARIVEIVDGPGDPWLVDQVARLNRHAGGRYLCAPRTGIRRLQLLAALRDAATDLEDVQRDLLAGRVDVDVATRARDRLDHLLEAATT